MPRHTDTPADHWRGVRGPAVLGAVLLVIAAVQVLLPAAVRLAHRPRWRAEQRAALMRQAAAAERRAMLRAGSVQPMSRQ